MKKILSVLPIFLICVSCSTVPLSNRKQIAFIPSSEINALSAENYQSVLGESKLSTNKEQTAAIKRVGQKIVGAVETYLAANNMSDRLDGYNWEFNLIESDQVNAWCMPGGKVAFYTAIMPICKTDDGIAVVMSHEISHAIAQHGNERMSQSLITQLGGAGLSIALKDQPQLTQQLAMTAFGAGAQVGVLLPYSRLQESEADELGLYFMAIAGYDPYEAPRFWERMEANSGGSSTPEFLSTHPAPETRIQNMQKNIPKALEYKAQYGKK